MMHLGHGMSHHFPQGHSKNIESEATVSPTQIKMYSVKSETTGAEQRHAEFSVFSVEVGKKGICVLFSTQICCFIE